MNKKRREVVPVTLRVPREDRNRNFGELSSAKSSPMELFKQILFDHESNSAKAKTVWRVYMRFCKCIVATSHLCVYVNVCPLKLSFCTGKGAGNCTFVNGLCERSNLLKCTGIIWLISSLAGNF